MNPMTMMIEGWCDDCDQDPAECFNLGYCIGEKLINEKEDNDDSK